MNRKCVCLIGSLVCSFLISSSRKSAGSLLPLFKTASKKIPLRAEARGGTEINDLSVRLTVDLLFEELDEFVFSHAALLASVAVA